ncbi:hypothetical protein PTSG_07980 [Salpingoeca rosetta]|uniref:Uncharacterized protein n=1 Tax=Salpingoeca rosetta (strain ATCC 50818 / BSB-021) TaxID=946362 RepID=F2UGW5_SALR5|nr:uncharacterized protein PTSG_07980 [Salpingoeca rosetta]EGD75865.1 hypothetical protein PTSG_07980 [Salpingoeca rosetta]|eukprot:XP_004991786.1 hypothetical protein PTSG_07980 [Salpingoeca rosetta]
MTRMMADAMCLVVDAHCHVHEGVTRVDDDGGDDGVGEGVVEGKQLLSRQTAVAFLMSRQTAVAFLMSTEPCQWKQVLHLMQSSDQIDVGRLITRKGDIDDKVPAAVACVGIHPWFAHRYVAERKDPANEGDGYKALGGSKTQHSGAVVSTAPYTWEEEMAAVLTEHERVVVGEIGLDFVAKIPESGLVDRAAQQDVFRRCLCLAGHFERPVSIHCVKAYEALITILCDLHARGKQAPGSFTQRGHSDTGGTQSSGGHDPAVAARMAVRLPPRIAVHSYGGSAETVKRLLRVCERDLGVQVFFGFSSVVSLRSERRARANIAAVPLDRLLVESDRADASKVDDELAAVIDLIADVKDMDKQHVIAALNQNALTWAGFLP